MVFFSCAGYFSDLPNYYMRILFKVNIGGNMNINGWDIDIDSLSGPNRKEWDWLEDKLYHCEQRDIAFLIYSIAEIRMNWYVGKLAVYHNKISPKLILNPDSLLCFDAADTVFYTGDGNLVFVKLYVYYEQNLECPICILNLIKKTFTILPIINGFNYNFIESGSSAYKLIEKERDDRFNSFTGKVFDLENLRWYDWELLNDFPKWYFDNKHLLIW